MPVPFPLLKKLVLISGTIVLLAFSAIRLAAASPLAFLHDFAAPIAWVQYPLLFLGGFLWLWGIADLRYTKLLLVVAAVGTVAFSIVVTGSLV